MTLGGVVAGDFQYTYDGNGNRLTQVVNGVQTSYTYNAASEMVAAGTTTYTYDANGNLTGSSAGLAITYNAKDQTTAVTAPGGAPVNMAYRDASQVERVSAGGTTYTDNLLGVGAESGAAGATYYTRDSRGRLIGERTPQGSFYYVTDWAGAIQVVTDASGNVVNTYSYIPFDGVGSSTGTVFNPWRFDRTTYADSATGLYKIGARYYDPAVGRWTQPDPAGGGYTYEGDNPYNFADPSGLCVWDLCISEGTATIVVAGATAAAFTAWWYGGGRDQTLAALQSIADSIESIRIIDSRTGEVLVDTEVPRETSAYTGDPQDPIPNKPGGDWKVKAAMFFAGLLRAGQDVLHPPNIGGLGG